MSKNLPINGKEPLINSKSKDYETINLLFSHSGSLDTSETVIFEEEARVTSSDVLKTIHEHNLSDALQYEANLLQRLRTTPEYSQQQPKPEITNLINVRNLSIQIFLVCLWFLSLVLLFNVYEHITHITFYLTLLATTLYFTIHPVKIRFYFTNPNPDKAWHISLNMISVSILCCLVPLAFNVIDLRTFKHGFTGKGSDIKPWEVLLILYFCCYMCISLNNTNILNSLAESITYKLTRKARVSIASSNNSNINVHNLENNEPVDTIAVGKKLFLVIVALTTVITLFTNNDVSILIMIPIAAKIPSELHLMWEPYCLAVLGLSNCFSLTFYTGNPANIIVAQQANWSFIQYLTVFGLPSLVLGFVYALEIYIFYFKCRPSITVVKKKANKNLKNNKIEPELSTNISTYGVVGGLKMLLYVLTLIFASVALPDAPFFRNQLVLRVSLIFTIASLISDVIYDIWQFKIYSSNYNSDNGVFNFFKEESLIWRTLKNMPWDLLPFVLSLFILNSILTRNNALNPFASALINFADSGSVNKSSLFFVIILSLIWVILCQVLNNLPMVAITSHMIDIAANGNVNNINLKSRFKDYAYYSLAIGANIGGIGSPIASLAVLLWSTSLKNEEKKFSKWKIMILLWIFIPIPTILACITLWVQQQI